MDVYLDTHGRYYQAAAPKNASDMKVVTPADTLKLLLDEEPRNPAEIQEEFDKESQVRGLGKALQVARVGAIKLRRA